MNKADRSLLVFTLILSLAVGGPSSLAQSAPCGPQTSTVTIPAHTARALVTWDFPGSSTYANAWWDCDSTHHSASVSGGAWQFSVTATYTNSSGNTVNAAVNRAGNMTFFGYDAGGYGPQGYQPPGPAPAPLPNVTGSAFLDMSAATASGDAILVVTSQGCVTGTSHWDGWPARNLPPSDTSYTLPLDFTPQVVPYVLGLGLSAPPPIIPDSAHVQNGCVQYMTPITGNVYETHLNTGVRNVTVQLASDRNAGSLLPDIFTQPAAASDPDGFVTGSLRTRLRGIAKITGSGQEINPDNVTPAYIDFHEANYESTFVITAYTIAHESDFTTGAQLTNPPGLTGTFNEDFLYSRRGVLMEGTGQDLNGNIITIDWNRSQRPFTRNNLFFTTDSCARTASNQCAVVDGTCAVDVTIIPMGPSRFSPGPATVRIDGVGDRSANDTGDAIQGRHIDLFVQDAAAANRWGRQNHNVRYISGGGNCN